jgi:hypothetical protein
VSASFDNSNKIPAAPGPNRVAITPQTTLGRWTLVMTLIAIASWWAFPRITGAYRDTFPITDTWIMPAILMVITDVAAALSVLAIWRNHERSILVLMAAGVMVPSALFVSLMVIGEGLAGV